MLPYGPLPSGAKDRSIKFGFRLQEKMANTFLLKLFSNKLKSGFSEDNSVVLLEREMH